MIYLKLLFLFSFNYMFIQCLVPGVPVLSVIKLDQNLINKKRQDTLDMCRMFIEDNPKLENNMIKNDAIAKKSEPKSKKRDSRPKRDLETVLIDNPALEEEDVMRLENIVDKIYDDMNETVKYIRLNLTENTEAELNTTSNDTKPARRFNFAPKSIYNLPSREENDQDDFPIRPVRFKSGVVPFFIDPKTYDSHLIDIITDTFYHFEKQSCIRLQRLRERPTDVVSLHTVLWIYITNPSGIRQCVHSNDKAKIQGVQIIVFGYDCMSPGDIMHEVMHILGFPHEHIRPDRDRYITVMWDNIKPGYKKYFEVDEKSEFTIFKYDYDSVLHYPSRAFSRNGQVTIWTEPGIKIGQRERLSETDLQKIDYLYSGECLQRNKVYLELTCPSAVQSEKSKPKKEVTSDAIKDYFKDRVWPFGVVDYKFKSATEFSTDELDIILSVIRHIEQETCIEFRDKSSSTEPDEKSTSDEDSTETTTIKLNVDPTMFTKTESDNTIMVDDKVDKAEVTKMVELQPSRRHAMNTLTLVKSSKPGCVCPHPGKPQKSKELVLNADCFNSVNDMLHVFVHVLGLDHQHNMHDRDSYLHIMWDQLSDDVAKEMKPKLPPAASAGFPYDYQSVMHCPWLQIKNGHANVMYPIWNDGWAMGHWEGLSSTDVKRLNTIYNAECDKRKETAPKQAKVT